MLNVAVVWADDALAKVTVPGPLTLDQVMVRLPGELGSPSSVALPFRVAAPDAMIVWSGPAFTTGAALVPLALFTVTVTLSAVLSAESLPVSWSS